MRENQRLQTRARVFEATVAEIGRSGLAGADVAAIAAAAGVSRGTFYFHFPTKEHVLVELERAEETNIVASLEKAKPGDLMSLLTLLVRHVLAAERRLGPVVFRDMLGLHFRRPGRSRTSWLSIRSQSSSLPRSPTRRQPGECRNTRTPRNSRSSSLPGCSRCWPLVVPHRGSAMRCSTGMSRQLFKESRTDERLGY